MHGIAVDRIELHFLPVQEGRLGGDRAGGDHVPVREDQATLGVDHEPGRLRGRVPLGVEGARRIDVDGDDAARNALEGGGPVGILLHRRCLLGDLHGLLRPPGRGRRRGLHGQRL